MSLAGKVLRGGRSNTRVSIFARDTATVVPRPRRRNRRSGGRRGSNGNRFRLLLLHWGHFSGGGVAEESSIVVVERRRRRRRRSGPHGAVEPFRYLLPHHFFLGIWLIDRAINRLKMARDFKFRRVSRRLSIRASRWLWKSKFVKMFLFSSQRNENKGRNREREGPYGKWTSHGQICI